MFTVHRASTDADWREATALLYDYVEWVRGWTDIDPVAEQPQLHAELAGLADHYATDDTAVYLAVWQAIAVGAVAIRVQADGSAELKRMYVRPVARGRGIADRLIDIAVAGATERQCHTAWLQTVRGAMDPAIAMYRRNGFAETSTRPPTLSVAGAIVMERVLSEAIRRDVTTTVDAEEFAVLDHGLVVTDTTLADLNGRHVYRYRPRRRAGRGIGRPT